MPRLSRNSIHTQYIHVMTQGINKSYIFDKEEDIKYYIKIMYRLISDYSLKIIAYCIMNNHTHILIEVPYLEELSQYMKRLNEIYAKYYNKKYKRVGYVFRDRYNSEGIYDEKHLYNCISYIYYNPVKAGICAKPEEYPYSNYKKNKKLENVNCDFIDIEEEKETIYDLAIDNFLKNNKINILQIKEDKKILKELICVLKNEYHMSCRKISTKIGVSREKVRRLIKEKQSY